MNNMYEIVIVLTWECPLMIDLLLLIAEGIYKLGCN